MWTFMYVFVCACITILLKEKIGYNIPCKVWTHFDLYIKKMLRKLYNQMKNNDCVQMVEYRWLLDSSSFCSSVYSDFSRASMFLT